VRRRDHHRRLRLPGYGPGAQDAIETWIRNRTGKSVIDYGSIPSSASPRTRSSPRWLTSSRGLHQLQDLHDGAGTVRRARPSTEALRKRPPRRAHECTARIVPSTSSPESSTRTAGDQRAQLRTPPRAAEGLATRRAVRMAGMVDAPVYLVPVLREALQALNDARGRQTVFGETRPLYLHLTQASERGFRAHTCWPPLHRGRPGGDHLAGAESDVLGRCHGHRVEQGSEAARPAVSSTCPAANLETLLPMLYSDGVRTGRRAQPLRGGDLGKSAKLFSLCPRKGTIAVGSDADIVVFDRKRRLSSGSQRCTRGRTGSCRRLRGDGLAGADHLRERSSSRPAAAGGARSRPAGRARRSGRSTN
jgi:hypothetical protein